MSKDSPHLDLSHGFIHMIRRHQLNEAQRIREMSEAAEENQKLAPKRLKSLTGTQKVKRPDAPLYSTGKFRSNQANTQTQPSDVNNSPVKSVKQEMPSQNINSQKIPSQEMALNVTPEVRKVLEAADIDSFHIADQEMLQTVITDFENFQENFLQKVVEIVVERAYKDPGYEASAVIVCNHIIQSENDAQMYFNIPRYVFRQALASHCEALVAGWPSLNPPHRHHLTSFLKLAFNEVKPDGMQYGNRLGPVIMKLLEVLVKGVKAGDTDQLRLLSLVFHDCIANLLMCVYVDDIVQLLDRIRDVFFHPDTQSHTRTPLLPILENFAALSKEKLAIDFSV